MELYKNISYGTWEICKSTHYWITIIRHDHINISVRTIEEEWKQYYFSKKEMLENDITD